MPDLPTIVQKITADITGLKAGIDEATKTIESAGKRMENIGKQLSFAVTAPITATLGLAAKAFGEQEKQEAKVNALLKQTGAEAWTTTESIKELASQIQKTAGISDELVLNAAGIMLTFRKVQNAGEGANAIFDRALRVMADMSAVLGTDISSSAIQLGKALEDPTIGLTALRRSGVSFSQAETEMIKKLVESGNLLEAQKIILDTIEGQLGNTARAMRYTFAGSLKAMASEAGDVLERVGQVIATIFRPLIEGVVRLAQWIKTLPTPIFAVGVAFATLAASIGPALYFGGKFVRLIGWLGSTGIAAINKASAALRLMAAEPQLLSQMFAGLKTTVSSTIVAVRGFVAALWQATTAHPVLLAIAAALLVITAVITTVVSFVNWAREHVESFRDAWDRLRAGVSAAWQAIAKVLHTMFTSIIAPILASFAKMLAGLAERIADWVNRNKEKIRDFVVIFGTGFTELVRLLADVIWPAISTFFSGLARVISGVIGVLAHLLGIIVRTAQAIKNLMTGQFAEAGNAARQALDEIRGFAGSIKNIITGTLDSTVGAMVVAGRKATEWASGFESRATATADSIASAFDSAWESASKAAGDATEGAMEEIPTPEEVAQQIPTPEEVAQQIPTPETLPPPPEPPTAPVLEAIAPSLDRAADKLSSAADRQEETAQQLRRVLLSRSGVTQLIGGLVQREAEETVLTALHEIEGGIRR